MKSSLDFAIAAIRRRLFLTFAADVRQLLQQDTTPFGQLTFTHISRQLDLIATERYSQWFRDLGERWGFDQAISLAAIAGSDVTRTCVVSEISRANFGTTQERVAALAAEGDLRFGRAFASYTALENLYMHAEGARHYTRGELGRRAAAVLDAVEAERAVADASEAILGHDSFNAGFGRHKLKPLLAQKYREPPEAFDYARSRTPSGFIIQVVDRLEGCEAETMLRYVTEGVLQRQEPISQAIKTGLVDNAAYLREVNDQIIADARRVLVPEQWEVFCGSPPMLDFAAGLERLPRILALLGNPPLPNKDGFYYLQGRNGRTRLDSLDVFRTLFVPAVQASARQDFGLGDIQEGVFPSKLRPIVAFRSAKGH